MNMANPIISAFTMDFVGESSREITSALQQALWAGSWFFSSQIFGLMREKDMGFVTILLTTAAIYTLGVGIYYVLIGMEENKGRLQMFHR